MSMQRDQFVDVEAVFSRKRHAVHVTATCGPGTGDLCFQRRMAAQNDVVDSRDKEYRSNPLCVKKILGRCSRARLFDRRRRLS
jgi:hypothetical protein